VTDKMLIRAASAVLGFAFAAAWVASGFYAAVLCLFCALVFAAAAPYLAGHKRTWEVPVRTSSTRRPNRNRRPTHLPPATSGYDPPSLESVDDLPFARPESYGW
jgi:hypothetical protein